MDISSTRTNLIQRGERLEYFTILWNTVKGLLSVGAGLTAGSIALVGFGLDSFIEVISGSALLWRMTAECGGATARNGQSTLMCFQLSRRPKFWRTVESSSKSSTVRM